jgi:hypothetical protein
MVGLYGDRMIIALSSVFNHQIIKAYIGNVTNVLMA